MSSPFDSNWSRILLVSAVVLVPILGISSIGFKPFNIVSSAMAPTLNTGDYLVTFRLPYGASNLSLPFGDWLPAFQIFKRAPHRGDVVVLSKPGDPPAVYVERVIGMPGDSVKVSNGITYVNGAALKREHVGLYHSSSAVDHYLDGADLIREYTPEGTSYTILESEEASPGDDTDVFEVPAGHYFVMGDNRDNSVDSRYDLGMVPEENIFAKAVLAAGKRSSGGVFSWVE